MDRTARFTGLLVMVTFLLVVVTGGLVWVALRQLHDARVLQRAYVSALPGGVSTTTRGELLAHVEFKNVGHSPASQIKSLLKFAASDDGEWSPPAVDDKDCALLAVCRSLASIVGALLTIASEIAIREGPLHRAEALWVVATKGGILLFLTTVALLPYRVSFVGGVICSILAAGTAITVFVAWDWIQRFSRPGGGGRPI
jgi:hypothetical protein